MTNGFVGGYRIDLENRDELRASATPFRTMPSFGDVPERVDIRKSDLFKDGWLPTENQGSIGSCFPAGTLVTMDDGSQVPIEEIAYGMHVVSHARKSRKVIDTMSRDYTGDMVTIWAKGWRPLKMTADHVVIVKRDGADVWVKAGEVLESDLVLLSSGVETSPVRTIDVSKHVSDVRLVEDGDRLLHSGCRHSMPRHIEIDELAAWCIGIYVAEGSSDFGPSGHFYRATWTLHVKETEYSAKLQSWADRLGVPCDVNDRKGSKARNVRMKCAVLASFLSTVCGRFCNKKQIPSFILSASDEIKLAFLRGYYDGDGSYAKADNGRESSGGNLVVCNQIHSSTASVGLATQVGTLAVSLGMKPGWSTTKRREHQRHDAHQIYLYSDDAVSVYPALQKASQNRRHLDREHRGQWRKIRSIEKEHVDNLPVYDITVEEDHSFVAGGVAVHNCQGQSASECPEYCYGVKTGKVIQFSRMYAYIRSQQFDNIRTDSGSTLSGGTKMLREGIPTEKTAPHTSRYPGWDYITDAMREEAKNFRMSSHTEIKQEAEVRSYIGSGAGIVQIGISWGNEMTPDSSGCVRRFTGAGGGGHAVVFCGYVPDADIGQRSTKGYWYLLKNSWGTRWGVQGYAYVDPSAVAAMLRHRWTVMYGRSDLSVPESRKLPHDFTKGRPLQI